MKIIGRHFEFPAASCFTFLDDPLYLIMINPDEGTTCECLYTAGEDTQTKESFDIFNRFNIHEIDEEESETEETEVAGRPSQNIRDYPPPSAKEDENAAAETKNASDNESVYTGDSFCSDESCDECDVTTRSLTSSLLCGDVQLDRSLEEREIDESRWKNDGSYSLGSQPRAATASGLAKPRKCRRWNMSFTDEEMRKIERENELLLRKIMAQQKPRHTIANEHAVQPRISSSAINRKKLQKKIESDNMLLLKRIQQAKSCVFSNASKMGCRLTFL